MKFVMCLILLGVLVSGYIENMSQPTDLVLIVKLFSMPTLPVAGFGGAGGMSLVHI